MLLAEVLTLRQNSLRLAFIVGFLAGKLSIKSKGYGGSSAFLWLPLIACSASASLAWRQDILRLASIVGCQPECLSVGCKKLYRLPAIFVVAIDCLSCRRNSKLPKKQ